MGMMLALLCGITIWGGGYVALAGKPIYRVFAIFPEKFYLIPLLVMGVFGWAWKIIIHLQHVDGWK